MTSTDALRRLPERVRRHYNDVYSQDRDAEVLSFAASSSGDAASRDSSAACGPEARP